MSTSHAIRHKRITPIAFRDPPLLIAAGIHEPWALRSIIEVEAACGLVGINETYGDQPMLDALARAAPALEGLSPWALNEMERRVTALVDPAAPASSEFLRRQVSLAPGTHVSKTVAKVVSAFEVALLDLQGQLAGAPVVDLLDGAAREMERAGDVPLATNMVVTDFAEFRRNVEMGCPVKIVLSDHHYWGGLRATQRLATLCSTFGLGLSMHSNSHLGVSLVAMTHLCASVPLLTYACDTHYPWQDDEVIEGGRLRFEQGSLRVPTAPGLGVRLDREALARLHDNYCAAASATATTWGRCASTTRRSRASSPATEIPIRTTRRHGMASTSINPRERRRFFAGRRSRPPACPNDLCFGGLRARDGR